MLCMHCNLEFNQVNIKSHVNVCKVLHDNKRAIVEDYLIGTTIKDLATKFNSSKNTISRFLKSHNALRSVSDAAKLFHKLNPKIRKHTPESKEKIRAARLRYMKENPNNTAWRKRNEPSYPEKIFINLCVDMGLPNLYDIEREYPVYPFYVDFAFINAKVAFEIDGSHHWLKDDVIANDKRKESLLQSLGWRIMRIPEFKLKRDIEQVINDVQLMLLDTSITDKRYENDILHHRQIKDRRVLDKKAAIEAKRNRYELDVIIPRKNDFDAIYPKHGWGVILGTKWNLTPQAASRFCKKHFIQSPKLVITSIELQSYLDAGLSLTKIAKIKGVHNSTISSYCKKYNITIPEPVYKINWSNIELINMMKSKSISQIAKELGVTPACVRRRAIKEGVL